MAIVRCLPAADSDLMAQTNRSNLDIDYGVAGRLAFETVRCCEAGAYTTPAGVRDAISQARTAKLSIPSDVALPTAPTAPHTEMHIQVANETTTMAAQRLLQTCRRVLTLNFANGVTPGGGFLNGARAQEETLCRMSALYPILVGDPMYAHHRARPDSASTAWAILSPQVPFFRNEDGSFLDTPWRLAILSCAAPVARQNGRADARRLLNERIHRVLAIAQTYGYDGLVLGAWGCGAFGNDPATTAEDFYAALTGPSAGAFQEVRFAITDWSPERRFLGPFRDRFTS